MASGTESTERSVPMGRRMALQSGSPAFAPLPPRALQSLAARPEEERCPAGSVVVTEGYAGDRVYVIS